jgi:hypothetical protein
LCPSFVCLCDKHRKSSSIFRSHFLRFSQRTTQTIRRNLIAHLFVCHTFFHLTTRSHPSRGIRNSFPLHLLSCRTLNCDFATDKPAALPQITPQLNDKFIPASKEKYFFPQRRLFTREDNRRTFFGELRTISNASNTIRFEIFSAS